MPRPNRDPLFAYRSPTDVMAQIGIRPRRAASGRPWHSLVGYAS